MILIISCGKKKCITKSKAKDMYIGSHFKRCLSFALSKVKEDKVFILSAKYGLLRLNDLISSYELKMGQSGSVDENTIIKQAELFNIRDEQIISTAGSEYKKILIKTFKNIKFPFEGLSMGYMAQAMKRNHA